MKTQNVSRKIFAELYKAACETWKPKLMEVFLEQAENNEIEFSSSFIMEAFKASNDAQKKLLKKCFKIVTPEEMFDEVQGIDDILRIADAKLDDFVPYASPKNKYQVTQNAVGMIQLLTKAYNRLENDGKDKVFDWTSTSQSKFYPWWDKSSGRWVLNGVFDIRYDCCLPFGCYFVTERACRDAIKKFNKVFMDYLPE